MRRIVSAIWHIVEEAMDDTDRRLVGLLRENARLPVATLAQLLKVSRGTVQNRIDRLTADGVIGGFTVRLKPEAEPQRVRAITMVAVEGEHTAAVLKSLRGIPEVQALHTTNGRWDIIVELGVESLEAFDQPCNASGSSGEFRIPRQVCCCRRTRFDLVLRTEHSRKPLCRST